MTLYARQSYKKRIHVNAVNKMVTESNSDVIMDSNPSYCNGELLSTQNRNSHEHQYDYIIDEPGLFKDDDTQGAVRMEHNPSYGRVQGCNTGAAHDTTTVTMQYPNPSYNTNLKSTTRISENEYYVEPNRYHSYNDTRGMGYLEIMAPVVADNVKTS